MRIWEGVISNRDREVLAASVYGARRGFGKRPALLVVDAQYKFVGIDAPILESMKLYPTSIGEEAWRAVEVIQRLIHLARQKAIPVIYSTAGVNKNEALYDSFGRKKSDRSTQLPGAPWPGDDIVARIAPVENDVIIPKKFPSCFFGTPLMTFLNTLDVDTLLVTGFVTSGCVRATVVDAASYNFYTAVIEDAVADRLQASHAVSLLDMDMKYADVVSSEEAVAYLAAL